MADRFYPTDAGELLLGPLRDYLAAMGVEQRARAERMDVRAEAKRRYEEHKAFLQAQAAQQSTMQLLAMDPQQGLAALPAVESWRARMGEKPLGAGTMAPSQTMLEGPPTMELRPPTVEGGPDVLGRQMVAGPPEQVPGLPTWEPGTAPPTHPVAASFYERLKAEEAKEAEKRRGEFGKALGGLEGASVVGHLADPRVPFTQPDVEKHLEARRAEIEAEREAKLAAAALRGGGRGGGAGRPPQLAAENKIRNLVAAGDYESFRRLASAGNILELRGGDEASVEGGFRARREAFEGEREDRASRWSNDRQIQGIDKEIGALLSQMTKALEKLHPEFAKAERAAVEGKFAPRIERLKQRRDAIAKRLDKQAGAAGGIQPATGAEAEAGSALPDLRSVLVLVLNSMPEEQEELLLDADMKGVPIPPGVLQAKTPKDRVVAIRRALGGQ